MRSAIVSGNAPVSDWSIFFPVPSRSPRNLSESKLAPVFSRYLSGGLNRFALIHKQIELLFSHECLISPKKPCEWRLLFHRMLLFGRQ